jgi:hypothetical protein
MPASCSRSQHPVLPLWWRKQVVTADRYSQMFMNLLDNSSFVSQPGKSPWY